MKTWNNSMQMKVKIFIGLILCYSLVSSCARITKKQYYYKEGKKVSLKESAQLVNNKLDGYWTSYCESGEIRLQLLYKNNGLMSIIRVYNKEKGILDPGDLVNGNGKVIVYDNNGDLKATGQFKDGYKSGKWFILNFKGDTIRESYYVDGWEQVNPNTGSDSFFYSPFKDNLYN